MQEDSSVQNVNKAQWEAVNWSRIQELFHLAETAPPGERTRILTEASEDAELVNRVLALLAISEQPDDDSGSAGGPVPTGRIGPYSLLRHLGTGGLGSVYLAERLVGGAVLRCAVKVLSMHAAGPAFEARFQREQQILSALNHPNITRMLDAGLSDNAQPYLAMEYVDGVDAVTYCDEHRLGIPERLALFQQICEAVAYAHRGLTVHLDLKPSNVLVTADGIVKLLDFGTSKFVDEASVVRTTTVLATPAYASPEQLRNEPVTTACDVYALGAMLFELLAGCRPYQDSSVAMLMEHALREQEPPRMSSSIAEDAPQRRGTTLCRLHSTLRGDLDVIVSRCMRPRPADRYTSVEALRDDLQRYRDGRPILARKQTGLYSLAKFVRRNRVAVAAGSFAALMALGSLVYAGIRQHQALEEGERAERMQDFLQSLLRIANANYMGKQTVTVPDFLQLGIKVLPEFIHRPADQRLAKLSLAESIFDNSDFQHALPIFQDIVQEAKAAGDVPTEAEAEAFGGMAAHEVGQTSVASELLDDAFALRNEKGVSIAQQMWIVGFYVCARYNNGIRPPEDLSLLKTMVDRGMKTPGVSDREIAWSLENLATMHISSGNLADAENEVNTALKIFQREPYTLCDQADAAEILGEISDNRGSPAEALRRYRFAYDAEVKCRGAADLNSLQIEAEVGGALVELGQGAEAERTLRPAVVLWRSSAPGNVQFARTLINLSRACILQGKYDDALAAARDALSIQSGKVKPISVPMAANYEVLAMALDGQHKRHEALQAAEKSESIYAAMPALAPLARVRRAANLAELQQLRSGSLLSSKQ